MILPTMNNSGYDSEDSEIVVINNGNIHDYVNRYFTKEWLPKSLADVPIGEWDVSKVTNMEYLFYNRTTFNEPLHWDVSNVTNMRNMFDNAHMFNQTLDWDVSKVETMNDMFNGASSFNQDISNWNVSNVKAMSGMFAYATSFNQDLSKWNISRVELMEYTFMCATSLSTYQQWNINKGVSVEGMYDGISPSG